jgi:hypothetical protein
MSMSPVKPLLPALILTALGACASGGPPPPEAAAHQRALCLQHTGSLIPHTAGQCASSSPGRVLTREDIETTSGHSPVQSLYRDPAAH